MHRVDKYSFNLPEHAIDHEYYFTTHKEAFRFEWVMTPLCDWRIMKTLDHAEI